MIHCVIRARGQCFQIGFPTYWLFPQEFSSIRIIVVVRFGCCICWLARLICAVIKDSLKNMHAYSMSHITIKTRLNSGGRQSVMLKRGQPQLNSQSRLAANTRWRAWAAKLFLLFFLYIIVYSTLSGSCWWWTLLLTFSFPQVKLSFFALIFNWLF